MDVRTQQNYKKEYKITFAERVAGGAGERRVVGVPVQLPLRLVPADEIRRRSAGHVRQDYSLLQIFVVDVKYCNFARHCDNICEGCWIMIDILEKRTVGEEL